jgi:hypothetical protein
MKLFVNSRWLQRVCWCTALAVGILNVNQSSAQDWKPDPTVQAAAKLIDEATQRAHIRFLADDLLEGRGPASRGDQLAQAYIATQFQMLGLKPAGSNGSWLQSVPLIGVTTQSPPEIQFKGTQKNLTLKYFDDYIATNGMATESTGFENAEVVFVGYGIVAPEYQWDDYKGVDLKGKILLMMNNDPADDPKMFEGKKRLYYGRWDYKYDSAARQGAVGAIIIHTTASAGYPYQVVQTSWTGEEFELAKSSGPRMPMRGWVTEDAARKICTLGDLDLDVLRKSAESRDFKPVSLGSKLSVQLKSIVRQQDTANVLGVLEGSDPNLKGEAVVVMAHHDHLGLAAERNEKGDNIYNGAIDNASGSASLLNIAKALTMLPERPKRSILFAAVGAEEQGLLGSKFFAENPTWPADKMAAVVNIDGMNFLGRSKDINVIGLGKSELDDVLGRIAKWQNRVITPDHFPDRGYYYRSDQFSLAKVGVPGIYLHSGLAIIGKPDGWGKEQTDAWVEKHYHQPSDEYTADWDLSGAMEDNELLFYATVEIANQAKMPQWTPGDEFEAARLKK